VPTVTSVNVEQEARRENSRRARDGRVARARSGTGRPPAAAIATRGTRAPRRRREEGL